MEEENKSNSYVTDVDLIFRFIAIICLITVAIAFSKVTSLKKENSAVEIQSVDTIEIVIQDEVLSFIKEINVAHPEVVFAQAILESGNFKSQLFIKYNNIFGMKMPEQRPTIAIGKTKSGYAIYKSWKHSVIDYAIYQAYSAKGLSQEKYIQFLNRVYAEDKDYDRKIKKIIEDL